MSSPATPRSRSVLLATDVPGIFRNRAGVLVDKSGVAVGFKKVKKADDDRFEEVLGHAPTTPLDIMKGVAMDPRAPLHVRMEAAKAATPYLSPKLVSVEGNAQKPMVQYQVQMTSKEFEKIARKLVSEV